VHSQTICGTECGFPLSTQQLEFVVVVVLTTTKTINEIKIYSFFDLSFKQDKNLQARFHDCQNSGLFVCECTFRHHGPTKSIQTKFPRGFEIKTSQREIFKETPQTLQSVRNKRKSKATILKITST
jgi:hypothetical protein